MEIPETRYARSGDAYVAYQVTGGGPFDLVQLRGGFQNVELWWESKHRVEVSQRPEHNSRVRRELARFGVREVDTGGRRVLCEFDGPVSLGARVAAQAGAGEVLVSSTVKDLVAGSGIDFADRGTAELNGIPCEWRLLAVES